ncbi:hypothetical protein RND81_13G193000 [Saponaria officinalis]|uniref:Snakin-1 n=1 Tax=Saponaria officinalis TaxID=3572 RepID=A0AAW1GZN9_SAPOF
MKVVKASVLVVTILLFIPFLHPAMALANGTESEVVSNSGCWSRCGGRCSKTEVKGRCMKYCSICCQKCNCVPSGTFGNKHECPCYRDWLNSKGKPKCP